MERRRGFRCESLSPRTLVCVINSNRFCNSGYSIHVFKSELSLSVGGMLLRWKEGAQRRERIFSHLSVRVSGMLAAALRLAPRLTRSLARRSPRSRFGEPISAGRPMPDCWMQRVRRRIERLLRRATLKRNSDGESISGMSGTDFHAIFSRERPSAFWPRLTRTNTHWRT